MANHDLTPGNPWVAATLAVIGALGLNKAFTSLWRMWLRRAGNEEKDRRAETGALREFLAAEVALLRQELSLERSDADRREAAVRDEKHKEINKFQGVIWELQTANQKCASEVAALNVTVIHQERTVTTLTVEVQQLRAEVKDLRERIAARRTRGLIEPS